MSRWGWLGLGVVTGAALTVFAFLVSINDDDAAMGLARFLIDDVTTGPTSA
jgi:hypothetical protein